MHQWSSEIQASQWIQAAVNHFEWEKKYAETKTIETANFSLLFISMRKEGVFLDSHARAI